MSWLTKRAEKHPLLILINGKLVRDEEIDPSLSLAYYLREKLSLTGTKIACGQGGCGACTVIVSRYYREEEQFRHYSTNACITPIASVHGCHIMTVEHLSDKTRNSCHPIQDAIVRGNGTQCGFCTPGMVMSMFASSITQSQPGESDIAKVKKAIQGNLCRCTGYRPILQAFKGLCGTGDVEDLMKGKRDNEELIEPARIITNNRKEGLAEIEVAIRTLFREKPNSFQIVEFLGPKVHWHRPNSLLQLSYCVKRYPEGRLVSGCTSAENQPQKPLLEKEVVIQIDWIKELHSFEVYENHVCFGGGLTISQLKDYLHSTIGTLPAWKRRSVKSMLCMLQRFGSPQIRNVATIGGCLNVNNSASDLQTLANALEFSALCFNPVTQEHIEVKSTFPLKLEKTVIVNLKIPFTMTNEYTWAYKLSRRRFFDVAIINLATKTQVVPPKGEEDAKIFKINVSLGGSSIRRFSSVFTYGTNPPDLTSELFIQMNNEIQREISSHLNTHMYSKVYISVLAKNLLKKFYEFLHDALHPSVSSKHSDPDDLALTTFKATHSVNLLGKLDSQGRTDLVWKPVPHGSAYKHATGEAIYCDDIPKFQNELAMELIWSKRAHAFLKKVDFSLSLKIQGVIGFISHHDLAEGKNLFGILQKDEQIFASDKVICVGQLIGAIVATDELKAKKAAELVNIEYIDCHPRILTISDAIGHNSFYNDHSTSLKVGNVEAALAKCEHVIADEVKLGGQIHFYMEPQSAIAIPKGEDDEMELIVATQNPNDIQLQVAHALGIEANKVVVRIKRVGGGFGGKDARSALVALPTAIAAKKFGRPVRCVLDRQTDMTISGKREPFLAKFEVGFNSEGCVQAIRMNIYSNAGVSLDASAVSIERAVLNIDNAYNVPNLEVVGVPCKSNKPSNTVFRGPGTVQGSHFIENIMDRVAAFLNKDPADIRWINMYKEGDTTPYGQTLENTTIRECWTECLESSDYYERKAEVELYNSTHLYRKRGLYLTPCHFGIGYIFLTLNQAGALVNIYQDGTVQLNHGGVEIGQGIHSKMIQIATRELGISASKIRIIETATDKVPNSAPTSASLSSDLNGMAIANACIILKERLEPYFKSFPTSSWEEIVSKAFHDRVNLSAVGFYKAPNLSWNREECKGSPFSYFVSGAACSMVEVDCLTGEYQILRTDIVMDVGKSLNPAIDLGQIEGAFMQGVGLFTLEQMVSDDFGNLLTTSPSTYKIPTAWDIPLELNVSFLQGSSNPRAIYSSKTVGEPPLLLANSVYFAIKDAVRQFRKQLGLDLKFQMDSPATVEKVLEACNDLYEPLIV